MNVDMPPGFEAKGVLGQGALGKVYKAWQPKLQRHVAIKTCRLDVSSEQGQDPMRLEDEALTIARLNHPNIVALYDVIREDQSIYLIMELLDGAPLSRLLNKKYPVEKLQDLVDTLDLEAAEALQTDKRFLKNEWICRVGIGVARALRYAHGRGVLHRDVKPANIVITHDRHVKLLDFSIARSRNTMGRTATGVVFGTVSYMSPEQVMNKPLDERTDIYAMGCTLYHAATGRVPFEDDNDITVCMNHVQKMADDPSALNPFLSPGLGEVIMRCMEKSPGNRYANTQDLESDLIAVLRGSEKFGVFSSVSSPEVPRLESRPENRTPPPSDVPQSAPMLNLKSDTSVVSAEPPAKLRAPESPRVREKRALNLAELAAMSEGEDQGDSGARPMIPLPSLDNDLPSLANVLTEKKDAPRKTKGTSSLRKRPLLFAVAAGLLTFGVLIGAAVMMNGDGGDNGVPPGDDHSISDDGHVPGDNDVAVIIPPRNTDHALPELKPTPRPSPTPQAAQTPVPNMAGLLQPVVPAPSRDIKRFRVPLGTNGELTMVEIPTGRFSMGSPATEPERREDEGPMAYVTFAYPYYISDTEITGDQFRAVMGADSYGGEGHLPVENVSWETAMQYCRKLSEQTGLEFQLPTEAQWEFAARAGTTTPFAFGEVLTGEVANIDGSKPFPRAPLSSVAGAALPVRSFSPNAWWMYDMHGNVWEMTRDWYDGAIKTDRDENAVTPPSGSMRVMRGGAYNTGAAEARSAARRSIQPQLAQPAVGFRVVVEL